MQQQIIAAFEAAFGAAPTSVVQAPGRVNLIGEHTDYNQGFVLPAAIDRSTWVALGPDPSGDAAKTLEVVAHDFDDQRVRISVQAKQTLDSSAPWSNYLRGVIVALRQRGYRLAGGRLLIAGNVLSGAGLSSSASLELALIRALLALSGESIDPTEAALAAQAAENDFVGCACGIMDQLISARGEHNSALLIDCQSLRTEPVAMPEDWSILIVHSGVRRGLVDSEYNLRRQQCEAGAQFFGSESLRTVSLETLYAAESQIDPLVFRRCRHVLTENARTLSAADAMRSGDLTALSEIMAASHASMRDDFEITTSEIDTLVNILSKAGAGHAGVRMTGGGFGGCVVALTHQSSMPKLMAAVEHDYQRLTGCEPSLIPARASAGAFSDQKDKAP